MKVVFAMSSAYRLAILYLQENLPLDFTQLGILIQPYYSIMDSFLWYYAGLQ